MTLFRRTWKRSFQVLLKQNMKRKKIIIIALTITIAVLAAMFFFLKPFIVVGESMFPAFSADERLVAETLSKHFLKIKRGETIVFREPHKREEIFVKRVIGLPGETVRLTDNSVTIISSDGAEETFGEGTTVGGKRNGDSMEMKLGPEDYFAMGDNRQKSTDSRHFGTVQPPDIIGRPILRGFPAKILFSLLALGEKTPIEAEGAYAIGSSLRFNDDDSAYLSRTPATAGNRKTWTYSLWLKRGSMGSINYILSSFSNSRTAIRFNATNSLLFTFESGLYDVETSALFRDPSAYLHLVVAFDTTQATASNRVKFYINGSQVTSLSQVNYPAQNYEGDFNNNVIQKIGADGTTTFDGLMSEINFIDGQALTPSSFGVTDGNGYWRPKAYTGTYGGNGFYLPFNDGTNTTTLGYDRSGNGNNYTLTNLATTDQMTDTPTNNYATWNPLDSSPTATTLVFKDGNLVVDRNTAGQDAYRNTRATMAVPSTGKWYWEVSPTSFTSSNATLASFGLGTVGAILESGPGISSTIIWYVRIGSSPTSQIYNGTTAVSNPTAYAQGDILQVAYDADSGKLWFGKNNSWINSSGGTTGNPSGGTNQSLTVTSGTTYFPFLGLYTSGGSIVWTGTFGQKTFSYTPPTGFKTLNTANLPEPTIVQPNKYFDAAVYAGTGAAQSIGLAGSSFVSGSTTVISFTSSGTWTAPAGVNSVEYLVVAGGGGGQSGTGGGAGGFRTATGFPVTSGTNYTVTVGAGGAAGIKGNDSVFSTITSVGGGGGNVEAGGGSGGGGQRSSDLGARTGKPGTVGQGNNGGDGMADNENGSGGGGGGGAGAVGGNGSGQIGGNGGVGTASSISGSSVTYAGGGGGGGGTGGSGGSGGGGAGGTNSATAGTANTGGGGGGWRRTDSNTSGGEPGGSGIVIIRYTPIQTIKFQPDLVWLKDRTSANAHGLFDSVRTATKYLSSNSTAAETTDTNSLTAFLTNGFSIGTTGLFNTSGNSYVSWNWKKSAISGFDIVSYTGNGSNRTIAHALGVAPEYIVVKKRGAGGAGAYGWYQWHIGLTSAVYSILFDTAAESNTATLWNSTAPTSSVFSVGTSNGSNENGQDYIAYLFAEVPGFSRFDKYTGNGSADGPFVWTGFKPKFVMIKRTDLTGGWLVYDTARQTFNVNDNILQPADTAAEVNPGGNAIDVLSNGFKSRSTGTSANASGGTYIYAAFAEIPFKYSTAADSAASGSVFFLGMSF